MSSDLPSPVQWNLQGGWLAANREKTKKEAPMSEMQGGWQFEGKEQPTTAKICIKCQGNRKTDQPTDEYDKSLWCEPCIEGRPLGHPPKKVKKDATTIRDQDGYNLNSTFFG